MEHLTKQQIVLVTLLVSFVTSLATGIVTVSLMDQAPQGVTHTINRVVERTIEKVSTPTSDSSGQPASVIQTVTISVDDELPKAVEKISGSTVVIKNKNGAVEESITGYGVIVRDGGIVMTDKSTMALYGDHVAMLPDGSEYPIEIFQSEEKGSIAFAKIDIATSSVKLKSASLKADSDIRVGTTIFIKDKVLMDGYIVAVASTTVSSNITPGAQSIGLPVFDVRGDLIGIYTSNGEIYKASNVGNVLVSDVVSTTTKDGEND